MEDMEDMEEITFAGQKYYLPKKQVKLFRGRLVREIYYYLKIQNGTPEKQKYLKFEYEYGDTKFTLNYINGLTDNMINKIIESDINYVENFVEKNLININQKEIGFLGNELKYDFVVDKKFRNYLKDQLIGYFLKRFLPETREDFKFLSEFISSILFYGLHKRLSRLRELKYSKEEENIIQQEIIFYIKKLNILERFGVDEFKFAQLKLDLQIKFLALMSIYKKPEQINSIINFFNSDLFTEAERNNFMKIILDEFLEEREDKDFVLKSKVVGQIGINQTTNEVMFEIIVNKLLNLNYEDKNQFIDKLEKFANYDENLHILAKSLGDSVKFNRPEFEIFFKYSYSEMIKKIIYAYNFDSNFVEKDITLVKFDEKIYENENLKNKILWLQEQSKIIIIFQNIINSSQWNSINSLEQMLWEKEMEILDCVYNNVKPEERKIYIYLIDKAKIILDKKIDIELITENLIEILLKGTESTKSLQQKEQIILTNAQKIFDDINNDKVEPGRREIYRKALDRAMNLAKEEIEEEIKNKFVKIYEKQFLDYINLHSENTTFEKMLAISELFVKLSIGLTGIFFLALNLAYENLITNFKNELKIEEELLNKKINDFDLIYSNEENYEQEIDEIFNYVNKLEQEINSSNQSEEDKIVLLKNLYNISNKKSNNLINKIGLQNSFLQKLREALLEFNESDTTTQNGFVLNKAEEEFIKIKDNEAIKDKRKYIKALSKAKYIILTEIHEKKLTLTNEYVDIFQESIKSKWWQHKKMPEEKFKIVNDTYASLVKGKSEIEIEALTVAKRNVLNELFKELVSKYVNIFQESIKLKWRQSEKSLEEKIKIVNDLYKSLLESENKFEIKSLTEAKEIVLNELLNEKLDEFAEVIQNNMITFDEAFNLGQKLEEKINSSLQLFDEQKKNLLEKLYDIIGKELNNILLENEQLNEKINDFRWRILYNLKDVFDTAEKLWKEINFSVQPDELKEILLKKWDDVSQIKIIPLERKELNKKLDDFQKNDSLISTSEEIFDTAEELRKEINSSMQPEVEKERLLEELDNIVKRKFHVISMVNKELNEAMNNFKNADLSSPEIFDKAKELEKEINFSRLFKEIIEIFIEELSDIVQEKLNNIALENERLNKELDEFAMNNSQTSEEIFDLGEKLKKDINSSSQPKNVKKSLLEKVNDIGQKKFENISPQQINSDFKFLTRP